MTNTIKCPKCGEPIEVTDLLRKQVEEDVLVEERQKHQKELEEAKKGADSKLQREIKLLKEESEIKTQKLAEAGKEELEFRRQKNALEEERKNFELEKQRQIDTEREEIRKKASEEVLEKFKLKDKEKDEQITQLQKTFEEEKLDLQKKIKEAQISVDSKLVEEIKLLKEDKEKKDKELDEARKLEIELRKQKNIFDEEKKTFALEKQRQLDKERNEIKQKAITEVLEQHQLKDKEKDEMISSLKRSLEEAQRKAEQGSQQTQGEVLELELEDILRAEFPSDEIKPVAKGTKGGDIVQEVRDKFGRVCGTVLWESKNAEWSKSWINKLKDDQRMIKADISVLVSVNLPKDIESFKHRDDIWITNRKSVIGLATALRLNLIQLFYLRLSNVGKNEKMEVVYNYLTGTEFKQRVEAIVEAFTGLQNSVEKEKRFFSVKWAREEKNIRKVIDNTHGMYGDMQSLIGIDKLPEIKLLDLPESENDSEKIVQESFTENLISGNESENTKDIDDNFVKSKTIDSENETKGLVRRKRPVFTIRK